MDKFRVTIASLPDRENLVAEIFYEGVQWVEISHEENEMLIHFYPYPNKKVWEFPLDEALKILENAKQKMVALGSKNPTHID